MTSLFRSLRSTLGVKFLMALTGLALMLFVLGHMVGNLLIFAGKEAINAYAMHLEDLGPLLWAIRLGLLTVFVLHIVLALDLTWRNTAARPTPYVREATLQATWASRNMLLTGLVILAFVVYHLLHFTLGVTDPATFTSNLPPYVYEGKPERDVAAMVVAGFRRPLVVAAYVVSMLFLGLHLWHGAGSWLQSLGLADRSRRGARAFGLGFALLIVIGNCSIPLAILFGFSPR